MILPPESALSARRLEIVPDGTLHYVPFSMLPSSRNSQEPLILKHEIVSLPALSVLKELRQPARRHGTERERGSIAVLADPVFDNNDVRVRRNGNTPAPDSLSQIRQVPQDKLRASASDRGFMRTGRLSFPRLLYARSEAESVLAVAGKGRFLKAVDFDASRATAMDPALGDYRILHFATHGVLDSARPEFSGLLLSLVDEHGAAQDGFLSLEDIYSLNLPVDLVVLSACQTALGKEVDGEGLVGLTRGFMYAGATRVVASLWNVDDLATSQLMANFYRIMLEEKISPAAALRKAQLQILKKRQWRSPYYWAAFQVYGEWN
jgi:CHAT domain-containing protein